MSFAETLPSPEFQPAPGNNAKWERERQAFQQMLPGLLATHRNKFVAIHDGRIAMVGDDQAEVALTAYRQFGYVPIYVGLVSDAPLHPARLPSPRGIS